MSHDIYSAPPPPPPPGYAPLPPPGNRRRRRWPTVLAAVAAGALVSSALAALIATQLHQSDSVTTASPTTVTVASPTPPPPAPLPTAMADRQTCEVGFKSTEAPTQAAADSLRQLPPGMKVLDPAVRANPQWAAAVRSAGEFYTQASTAQAEMIAPGTTPVLAEAAQNLVDALSLVGNAYVNFYPIAGNAYEIVVAASDQMTQLCTRLAP